MVMTDKELSRLNRRELLEILYELSKENDELKVEVQNLQSELENNNTFDHLFGLINQMIDRLEVLYENVQTLLYIKPEVKMASMKKEEDIENQYIPLIETIDEEIITDEQPSLIEITNEEIVKDEQPSLIEITDEEIVNDEQVSSIEITDEEIVNDEQASSIEITNEEIVNDEQPSTIEITRKDSIRKEMKSQDRNQSYTYWDSLVDRLEDFLSEHSQLQDIIDIDSMRGGE